MTQKELTDRLDKASRDYYNGIQSEYTDNEFDKLMHELKKMEVESDIVYPNSPTLRVGSDIQDGFKKIKHHKPMLTIDNAYDDVSIEKWVTDNSKKYHISDYDISIKYDGISCDICYIGGIFKNASTRGDKLVGDDITENVKTIRNIPLDISKFFVNPQEEFHVRGEILLPKSRLSKINEERETNGEMPFANTRNACSGSIKQLDPKVTAKRGLIFRAWDCDGLMYFGNMEDKVEFLEKIGFYYEDGTKPFHTSSEKVINDVDDFYERINALNLDYDYDGIVIKIDSIQQQEKIGTVDTRAVEWAIARKWNEENIVSTTLERVEWFVGRTGILTPVGKLKPVNCNGVVISNVTLHNMDFIEKNKLSIGDEVFITRSGGVIPYLCGIKEKKSTIPIHEPLFCPVCGEPLVRESDSTIKCTNEYCKSIVCGKLLQFCSKDCMNIKSIGEQVINDFYDKIGIRTVLELYELAKMNAAELAEKLGEGYKIKSCQNIIDGINESKKKPFANVLYALSIPNIGKVNARILAKQFKNIEHILNASDEDFMHIDGIGLIMANSLYNWCHDEENEILIRGLMAEGLNFSDEESSVGQIENGKFDKLIICFTGKSSHFNGDEVEEFFEKNGAKCVHNISKNVNYLIIGDKPGGVKIKKAKEIGVPILSEEEFFKKFEISF